MSDRRNWTRDELIVALNLYLKIPYGSFHNRNPIIIELAPKLNRTPDALAWKLSNFASLDPYHKARGVKGAANTGKLDKIVWDEFFGNAEELYYQSEKMLAGLQHRDLEKETEIDPDVKGTDRERLVKVRVNQNLFRIAVLESYPKGCCITGLSHPTLLIASHIKPWSVDTQARLKPENGLCLNALHDKAFDKGLLTITTDYKVKISPKLLKDDLPYSKQNFLAYHDQPITLPSRFLPDRGYLEYHNQNVFQH